MPNGDSGDRFNQEFVLNVHQKAEAKGWWRGGLTGAAFGAIICFAALKADWSQLADAIRTSGNHPLPAGTLNPLPCNNQVPAPGPNSVVPAAGAPPAAGPPRPVQAGVMPTVDTKGDIDGRPTGPIGTPSRLRP